jgi:hypothetical protein
MKNQFTAAVFGAALLLAAAPAVAMTAPVQQNAPIRIDDAQVAPLINEDRMYDDGGFVNVTFTNERAVPATDVVFAVENDRNEPVDFIHDRGTFSQGVEINHVFSALLLESHLHLAVAGAHFADGTSWSAWS